MRQLPLQQGVVTELRFQRIDGDGHVNRVREVGEGGGDIEFDAADAEIMAHRRRIDPPQMDIRQESHAGQRQAGVEQGPLLDARVRCVDQVDQQVRQTIAGIVLRIQAALTGQPQLLEQGNRRRRRLLAIAPK
jgi:hypothetical protein